MRTAAELHFIAAARDVEQCAIARLGDPFALMRRAGHDAWQALLQRWPSTRSVLVVCGPGNNGGDGYVLAELARQSGRRVRVACLSGHVPGTGEARHVREQFLQAGGELVDAGADLPSADAVVDALFGIGLSRALEGEAGRLVEAINAHPAPVLALDVPSGVEADTGAVQGPAVIAQLTLEFLVAKAGLRTGAARDHVGHLQWSRLGVDEECFAGLVPGVEGLQAADLGRWLRPRLRDSHKGRNGRLLCIGGDHGHGGAILLAAEAALRSGAGLVDVATRGAHVAALLARLPEAMGYPGIEDGTDDAASDRLLASATAITVGPGLGQSAWSRRWLDRALHAGRPLVLDADALNLMASQGMAAPAQAVLTPHPGEAARLLGTDTASVQADRFSAARQLALRFGAVAVLKGAGTIVAAEGHPPRLIDAGNPGMAVGGMGDVLAGVIGALLAQGMPALEAASCGALLHSVAGDSAAADGGERGLLPSDLMPWLRRHANPENV